MIPELYQCQKKAIADNLLWTGIFWGTGVGKTRVALELAEGRILIITEKQGRDDRTFQDNAEKFNIKKDITVISKEDFRATKGIIDKYDTVIVDECHHFLGVHPETRQRNKIQIPKTSLLFEYLDEYLKNNKPKRFYLLSATPVSKPLNAYAAGRLLGHSWDYWGFREEFYTPVNMNAYKPIWLPKTAPLYKERVVKGVKALGYTGALADFEDVPEQTFLVKHFDLTADQKQAIKSLNDTEADPMAVRTAKRTIENGVLYGVEIEEISGIKDRMKRSTIFFSSEKIDYILEKAQEFPKMLIFAAYLGQIEAIRSALVKEGYTNVKTVTSANKDRGTVFKEADESDAPCILIVTSSISSGYELPSFPVTIYASYSNKVRDKIQADGRTLRANKMKKNLYISLVVKGGLDEQCYKNITNGEDFQERIMKQ